jgi:hypothetical protein
LQSITHDIANVQDAMAKTGEQIRLFLEFGQRLGLDMQTLDRTTLTLSSNADRQQEVFAQYEKAFAEVGRYLEQLTLSVSEIVQQGTSAKGIMLQMEDLRQLTQRTDQQISGLLEEALQSGNA